MKTIEETLLNRTSVRRYEYDKIPSETLDFIYRAIANTPTSYNGQQFSVIAIDDQSIKEELYAITNQKQIKKQKGKGRLDYVADLDWMCYSKGLYEFD